LPINKIKTSFKEAIEDIKDGASLMIGGFGSGPAEPPSWLIRAIADKGIKDLSIIANLGGWGRTLIPKFKKTMGELMEDYPWWYDDHGLLVENGQVKKIICSWASGMSPVHVNEVEKRVKEGKIEVEILPQGTLCEKIRAARAGIAAFYVGTGVGTLAEKGKEVRDFNGEKYILEQAFKADFALIHAHKADRWGNLVYRGTGRSFNALMAGAARVTIAEVDKIVELGELDPEVIVTPGIYVDRVVARPWEEIKKWMKGSAREG
jgi:3-oxoadipate CoA-transferase alpha subunit